MIKRIGERTLFESKHFQVKEIELELSSGKRTIHQITDSSVDGVTVVPITKDGNVLFVREYHTGANEYQLGLCKGGIKVGHSPEDTYATFKTYIFLARDLEQSKLAGDEAEELEVVPYLFKDFEKLIDKGELHDVRVIAALYLAKRFLEKEEN